MSREVLRALRLSSLSQFGLLNKQSFAPYTLPVLGCRWLQESSKQEADAHNGGIAPRRIFVRNIGDTSSTAPILLGLMNFFKRQIPHVGFFSPVASPPFMEGLPRHLHLLKDACALPDDPRTMQAISEEDAFQMLANGQHTEFLDKVFAKFNDYQTSHEMVVIDGWRAGGSAMNAQLAAQLDAPALLVVDYEEGEDTISLYDRMMTEVQEYMALRAEVMGIILNKVPPKIRDDMHQQMTTKLAGKKVALVGTIPFLDKLAEIRLDQIYHQVEGKLLFSSLQQVQLDTPLSDILVATSQCGTMLLQMEGMERPLVVTTPDRIDAITTCMAAHMGGSIPIAGVMIACHDGTPSPYRQHLQGIFDGLEQQAAQSARHTYRLPIFMTNLNVFDAVQAIGRIDPAILATSTAKIDLAKQMFDQYVNTEIMMSGLAMFKERFTPSKFLHSIRERCRATPQRIVLPESTDHRILTAASVAQSKGLAQITLLGDDSSVLKEAGKMGLDMTGVTIINPTDPDLLDRLSDDLVEARQGKGVTKELALNMLRDVNYVGTELVRIGMMDGLVSGAIHTTAATIRPGMQVLKTKEMPLISSVFFMCLPDKVLVYGDCAVNVEPTAEQLAYIAIASAETAAAFGIEPRVAMLSYSTLGSGSGPQVEKVTQATKIAQEKRPDLKLAGPMQYDAATNPRVAAVKVKNDATGVAGNATVLIFPDLNTGNNTYKAVQQASGAIAMGPIIQGLSRPVNDLSRGCTVADIVDTICATSLQAIFIKAKQAGKV